MVWAPLVVVWAGVVRGCARVLSSSLLALVVVGGGGLGSLGGGLGPVISAVLSSRVCRSFRGCWVGTLHVNGHRRPSSGPPPLSVSPWAPLA